MPILSRSDNWIHAKCANCARTFSACNAKDVRHFYRYRRRFRRDLCRICQFEHAVGHFEYACGGCDRLVRGNLAELGDCLNVHNLALCHSCKDGFYGPYDVNNEALMIAVRAIETKTSRTEPRRFPHALAFREEEAAYGPTVRNLTRRNYHIDKNRINPKDRLIGPSGADGAHHIDHIVPISLCFRCSIPVEVAAAPANLQVIPWRINLMRGSTALYEMIRRHQQDRNRPVSRSC